MEPSDLRIGRQLRLLDEDIFKNLRNTQLRNGLSPSESLDGFIFTVEMETGAGKTHVYLPTIFEIHQAYGFTKLIIVVPSIAMKEGSIRRCRSPKSTSRTRDLPTTGQTVTNPERHRLAPSPFVCPTFKNPTAHTRERPSPGQADETMPTSKTPAWPSLGPPVDPGPPASRILRKHPW